MKTYAKLYRVKKYNGLTKDYEYIEEEPRFFRTVLQGRRAITQLKKDTEQHLFGLFPEGPIISSDISNKVVFLEFQHQLKTFFSVSSFTLVVEKQVLEALIEKYRINLKDLSILHMLLNPTFFRPIHMCETNKIYVVPYQDNVYLGKLLTVADS